MAKSSVVYECSNCGAQSPKWAGQCSECGKWNTLSETVVSDKISNRKFSNSQIKGKLLGLDEVEGNVGERVSTKIGELDRVLGGGLVSGEVVLMVGEPGIGKSTLLTQLALNMGNENLKSKIPNNKQIQNSNKLNSKEFDDLDLEFGASTRSVVYVCGEESPGQVKIRVNRMGGEKKGSNLKMLAEMDIDTIISIINKESISLLIIDSVQTIYTSDLPGLAGSVSQIRTVS